VLLSCVRTAHGVDPCLCDNARTSAAFLRMSEALTEKGICVPALYSMCSNQPTDGGDSGDSGDSNAPDPNQNPSQNPDGEPQPFGLFAEREYTHLTISEGGTVVSSTYATGHTWNTAVTQEPVTGGVTVWGVRLDSVNYNSGSNTWHIVAGITTVPNDGGLTIDYGFVFENGRLGIGGSEADWPDGGDPEAPMQANEVVTIMLDQSTGVMMIMRGSDPPRMAVVGVTAGAYYLGIGLGAITDQVSLMPAMHQDEVPLTPEWTLDTTGADFLVAEYGGRVVRYESSAAGFVWNTALASGPVSSGVHTWVVRVDKLSYVNGWDMTIGIGLRDDAFNPNLYAQGYVLVLGTGGVALAGYSQNWADGGNNEPESSFGPGDQIVVTLNMIESPHTLTFQHLGGAPRLAFNTIPAGNWHLSVACGMSDDRVSVVHYIGSNAAGPGP